jgi:hypothetical protein
MLLSLLKNLARRPAMQPPPQDAPAPEAFALPRFTHQRGGTVIAFAGPSEGDALKQMMVDLLQPLRPACRNLLVIELGDPGWPAQLQASSAEPVWFVFSPFGAVETLSVPGGQPVNPWAEAGIPFVRGFGDTPAYFPNAHIQRYANAVNFYAFAEHLEFFQRAFDVRAPCLALASYPFDALPREQVDARRKAQGTIIFPKNGNCPDRLIDYWRDSLPPAVARALEAVAEEASASIDQPFDLLERVQAHFARLGVRLPERDRLTFFLVAQLDDYLRRRKSTLIARVMLDYPVVIRGTNWQHVDFAGKRARHDPDSNYGRTRSLIDESLAVMDMSPNTQRSAHDRCIRAAGRYTAFLTNRQQFYVDHFDNHRAFTFLFNRDSIRERVEAALARPRETVEMGIAQGERMRELMPAERYFERLLAVVDACALACGQRPPDTQNFVHFNPIES